jgi:replication factor C subunit 1
METWLNKYIPKSINEVIGNDIEKNKIHEWFLNFEKNQTNKNVISTSILVLIGSHGIGKTLLAELIAKQLNYKILNINLFNSKNQKDTLELINNILSSKNIVNQINKTNEKYAIIVKDCDTITKNNSIINLFIKNDTYRYFPIILISNNQYNKFMLEIKKLYTSLYFKTPTNNSIGILLDKIISTEKISIDLNVKNKIIDFAQNDFRRLINIIEDIYNSINKKTITIQDINKYTFFSKKKNLDIGLIDSTRKLISNYTSIHDIIKLYNNEKVLLPLMLHDYYIKTLFYKEIPNKLIIPTIQKISDSMSYSDIVETNIYVDQNWYLHDIYGFFSCVKTSFELNKFNNHPKINTKPIDYYFPVKYSCSDINKTATRRININRLDEIENSEPIFKNKTLNEMLFINKYLINLLEKNNISRLKEIMKQYNLNVKNLDKILKIDKTIKPYNLSAKQKKLLQDS